MKKKTTSIVSLSLSHGQNDSSEKANAQNMDVKMILIAEGGTCNAGQRQQCCNVTWNAVIRHW